MPRAVAAFEAAGVPVIAAPTDWQSDDANHILQASLMSNLAALDLAVHEYLGLLAQTFFMRRTALDAAPNCAVRHDDDNGHAEGGDRASGVRRP
jgi:hypothetical protein